jgi:c-di-GMP-binding flagellar brake protein YcgR
LLRPLDRAKFGSVETKEMKNINRRESPRIEIKLKCHVSSPALRVESALSTENISRSGVLIAWRGIDAELPIPSMGQIVTVEIELPANHGFGQKCIHCQGSVMRITNSAENFPLIALRVNYMDFRSFHDRIRAFEAMRPVASSPWMA